MSTILISLQFLIPLTLLVSLVFTLGIIWRTEKKLDLTYRFMLVSVSALLASQIVGLGYFFGATWQVFIESALEFLGVLFLLLSILEMRDIVRFLDKEER